MRPADGGRAGGGGDAPAAAESPGAIEIFTGTDAPLGMSDAAAALILLEDGRYLLQLRDSLPAIWYPDHWSCFGGAVDAGEDAETALRRELDEELAFRAGAMTTFARFDFDLGGVGLGRCYRHYFVVPMRAAERDGLVLREGRAMQAFRPEELGGLRITPYDSFALFLYHARGRIGRVG